jgi:uncharacterized cysteine cluster protein YcgN (CxxCxxCC family)
VSCQANGSYGRGSSHRCEVFVVVPVGTRCVIHSCAVTVTASEPARARWHPALNHDDARMHSRRVSTSGICVMRPLDRNGTPRIL